MYTPNEQQALTLLEQTRNTVEAAFYLLRDEPVTTKQLQRMHSNLRDAADSLFTAAQIVKQLEAAE
jgi:hypothetical protein